MRLGLKRLAERDKSKMKTGSFNIVSDMSERSDRADTTTRSTWKKYYDLPAGKSL